MNKLSIEGSNNGLMLIGELNYSTITPTLWEQSKVLFASLPSPIKIDLTKVSHSDSTGVALLVSWMRNARKIGKTVELVNVPDQMMALIKVSGLEQALS